MHDTWPKVLRDETGDDPDAAAVTHFCSPVRCVFREWTSTRVFVPWFSCMYVRVCVWVWVVNEALLVCLRFTSIPHCVSTVFPNVCVSHCPVQRLLCVWVCGCWLYSRLLTLSDFCLWFSHSCSDGNKGLFIVWYITFLQRFVSLKLHPSFLTKQPELVLLSNVLFTDCSDVVFNTKSLCNRVQLGCSFQNNENVKMFQEG